MLNEIVKSVSILGEAWTITYDVDPGEDPDLDGRFGYCARNARKIVIVDLNKLSGWKDEAQEVQLVQHKITVRHEIIHAYLFESGLAGSSNSGEAWATNEEMTDWFALQWPKINRTFAEVGCL